MTPMEQQLLSEALEVLRKFTTADNTINEISKCSDIKNVAKMIELYRQEVKSRKKV